MIKDVLRILKTPGSDKRPIAIARKLEVTKEQVNILMDELERLGYLERTEKASMAKCSSFECNHCPYASSTTEKQISILELVKKC
ncbi:MAG: hypothetical protein KAR35_09510 [Candidatus Heimdallarchaeota archaeon]|nr:hypothetical protein [Candidatus Heimdallarchaeota archaeon]MCK5049593.1 hypothetical protein [Candidatus Heimdallarchaeota archaeon]